jgi:uncharacterized delta-60 repeat protein
MFVCMMRLFLAGAFSVFILSSCGGGTTTPSPTPKNIKLSLVNPPNSVALKQGVSVALPLTISRADFDGAVDIKLVNNDASPLPDWFKATPIQIAAGATTGTMTVEALDSADLIRNACGLSLIATSPASGVAYAKTGVCVQLTSAIKSGRLDTSFAEFGALDLNNTLDLEIGSGDELFLLTRTELRKLDANGQPNTTFGVQGVVAKPFGFVTSNTDTMAITASNKLVVVGSQPVAGVNALALAQYTSAGVLDAGFGTAGKATFPGGAGSACDENLSKILEEVTVGADGKIRALGNCSGKLVLITVGADGALETSYGTNGYAMLTNSLSSYFSVSLAVDAAGRVLVAAEYAGNRTGLIVSRFTAAGVLDSSFGTGGEITLDLGATQITPALSPLYRPASLGGTITNTYSDSVFPGSTAIQILTDKKILIATSSNKKFAVARLLEDGSFDSGFASNGRQVITVGSGTPNFVDDITLQKDNKILISGLSTQGSNKQFLTVVRLTSNGQMDTSFGDSGLVGLAESNSTGHIDKGSVRAIGVQSGGQIVLAGSSLVARLFP